MKIFEREGIIELGYVFMAELDSDKKTVVFTELCDYHFEEVLNKQEAQQFIGKLQALIDQLEE